jgi:hypothetical protein
MKASGSPKPPRLKAVPPQPEQNEIIATKQPPVLPPENFRGTLISMIAKRRET